jgi:biopolymer transport protein ExbB
MIPTTSLPIAFLMGQTPMELFRHGGYIMWPIILTSFLALTVIVERIIFIIRENAARDPEVVEKMLDRIEHNDVEGAIALGRKSNDYLARILVYTLTHRETGFSNALIRASNQELIRFQRGLPILDTVITVAQLLGLLGTVTGMMNTFGALGEGDIAANASQITGGVGEALIAVASGLAIAIAALLPFNYMNARVEQVRHELTDATNALELIMKRNQVAG